MEGPWVVRNKGSHDYGRVVECVWHHRDGGLCFLDVGRGLHSAVPPFHILGESDYVTQLYPWDDEWDNWQVWLDFLASPDYVEANCRINYDNLRDHGGALIDRPYKGDSPNRILMEVMQGITVDQYDTPEEARHRAALVVEVAEAKAQGYAIDIPNE